MNCFSEEAGEREKGREREEERREGDWGGGGGEGGRGQGQTEQQEMCERENNRRAGFEMKKIKTTASPIKELFFCFVLFCFFGHGQSVTLAFVECVMNYTPPLLCLCCGEVPAVCTSYNILRCEFSMPVYQPGLF